MTYCATKLALGEVVKLDFKYRKHTLKLFYDLQTSRKTMTVQ